MVIFELEPYNGPETQVRLVISDFESLKPSEVRRK